MWGGGRDAPHLQEEGSISGDKQVTKGQPRGTLPGSRREQELQRIRKAVPTKEQIVNQKGSNQDCEAPNHSLQPPWFGAVAVQRPGLHCPARVCPFCREPSGQGPLGGKYQFTAMVRAAGYWLGKEHFLPVSFICIADSLKIQASLITERKHGKLTVIKTFASVSQTIHCGGVIG